MKPKTSKPSAAATAADHRQELERMARSMINAINTRNLSPSSAPWSTHTTVSFRAEVNFNINPAYLDLPEWLTQLSTLIRTNPTLQMNISNVDITFDDATHGHAFCNLEWHGSPEGFVRPVFGIFDFVRVQGAWSCLRFRVLPVIAAGGMRSEWAQ